MRELFVTLMQLGGMLGYPSQETEINVGTSTSNSFYVPVEKCKVP